MTTATARPLIPVADAAAIEAVEAELTRAIYDATRLARRRMLGLEAPPEPSKRGLELLERARRR